MWRIRLSESGSFLCRRDSVLLCTRFLGAAPKAPEIFWMDTPAERPSSPLLMSAIPSILTSEAESLSAAPVNNRLFVATISVTTTSSSIPELKRQIPLGRTGASQKKEKSCLYRASALRKACSTRPSGASLTMGKATRNSSEELIVNVRGSQEHC